MHGCEITIQVLRVVMLVSRLTALVFGLLVVLVSLSLGAAIRGASGFPHSSLRRVKSPVSQNDFLGPSDSKGSDERHGEATVREVPRTLDLSLNVKVTENGRYDNDAVSYVSQAGGNGYAAEKRATEELVKNGERLTSSAMTDEVLTTTTKTQERKEASKNQVPFLSSTKSFQKSEESALVSEDPTFPSAGKGRIKEEKGDTAKNETRSSHAKNRCEFRSAPPDVVFPDAFEEFSRSMEANLSPDDQPDEELLDSLLPDGCHYTERQKKKVMCTGANMTSIPEFEHARNIETLHFSGTSIVQVTNLDPLPRSLKALYFSNGMLKVFDGRNLNRVSGLEVLHLDNNFITSWSLVTTFYSMGGFAEQNTIKTLNIRSNQITYPVSTFSPSIVRISCLSVLTDKIFASVPSPFTVLF